MMVVNLWLHTESLRLRSVTHNIKSVPIPVGRTPILVSSETIVVEQYCFFLFVYHHPCSPVVVATATAAAAATATAAAAAAVGGTTSDGTLVDTENDSFVGTDAADFDFDIADILTFRILLEVVVFVPASAIAATATGDDGQERLLLLLFAFMFFDSN